MTMDLTAEQKQDLINFALEQGFDVIRVTDADLGPIPGERFEAFLKAGYHGDMDWLEARKEWRKNPVELWRDAKSALVLGLNYGPDQNPLQHISNPDVGVVSVYARGRDYHDIIKKRLKKIARHMVATYQGDVKVFVDTAPVMEKPLAAAAGLGWQGKHTNLLSRQFGSWLFLGVILTTLKIKPDEPETGGCGRCTACLDACPTNAFISPYQMDARRCISYLTIETREHIPREMRPLIGNRIYGCDDCLAVCPWNKYASNSKELKLQAKQELNGPSLSDLLKLDDASFRELFRGSAAKRLGRNRFIRNVIIATGNSANNVYVKQLLDLLRDPASMVRLAAVWALGRLTSKTQFENVYSVNIGNELDPAVVEEWQLSLKEFENE
ncbi:tRNA epoxyqueuosine(34) reductase QueG [Sneathiella glossodoripedis]|uniref:tRNA epoxyqueuosine(34) reductase QueG n=1 Tax=Sneathiella glossodoripedis TaxID=418853 RepID=UPI000470B437|nr:tRNA epoxyqueuosine(34) reductase QueG [Sneathiella glossodoripedis]